MKKLIALALSLLLLVAAVPALAEEVYFESLGATIVLPEGMMLVEGDALTPELVEATGAFGAILDEANQAYVLFSYTEDDSITPMDLTALSEEEIAALAITLVGDTEIIETVIAEIANAYLLGVTFLDGEQIEQSMLFSLEEGGVVVIAFMMADNSQVPAEIGAALVEVLTTLSFDYGEAAE